MLAADLPPANGENGTVLFWMPASVHDLPLDKQDEWIERVKVDVGRRAEEMIHERLGR